MARAARSPARAMLHARVGRDARASPWSDGRARFTSASRSLADSRSKTFSQTTRGNNTRAKKPREASGAGGKERGGRGGDARVPRDDCDGQLDDAPSLGSPACFGRSSSRHDHHARPHGAPPHQNLPCREPGNPKADSRETPQQPWMENWLESRVVRNWRWTVIGPYQKM
jgi:hypothetical protein